MKSFAAQIALVACLAIGGCQSTAKPAPGMATLVVQVSSEVKTGFNQPTADDSYGGGGVDLGSGKFEEFDYNNLDNIVVWLQSLDGAIAGPPADQTVEIALKEAPEGSTGVTCVAQRIKFRNACSTPLNLYSASGGNEFNLGVIQPGAEADYVVCSAGLIEIWTDALANPVAVLYSAPTSWFRVTRAGKSATFADLPPGRYKIVSWHPRLPGHESVVNLAKDQISNSSIKVTVNGLPVVPAR